VTASDLAALMGAAPSPGGPHVPMTIASDRNAGAAAHMMLSPPAGLCPVPIPGPSIEVPTRTDWSHSMMTPQDTLSKTVKHKGELIALDGHDCGKMIPDITPVYLPNAWYPICWSFSSRKMVFSASKIKIQGKPAACHGQQFPMMCCGEPVSFPGCLPITNQLNTVQLGMTPEDVKAGIERMFISVALDAAFAFAFGFLDWAKSLGEAAAEGGKAAVKAGEQTSEEMAEQAAQQMAKISEEASEEVGKSVPRGVVQDQAKPRLEALVGADIETFSQDPTAVFRGRSSPTGGR
jgi:hypothetical protein